MEVTMRRSVISLCSLSFLACQGTPRLPQPASGNNPPLIQDATVRDTGSQPDSGVMGGGDAVVVMDAVVVLDAEVTSDSGMAGGADATSLDAAPFADASGTGGADAAQSQDAGSAGPMKHLLISELATGQAESEFIEIWNPGTNTVDLGDYYLSDNSAYVNITRGPWSPAGTLGTDFAIGFPPGATLAADAVLHLTDEAGEHSVTVKLHRDVEAEIKVYVIQE